MDIYAHPPWVSWEALKGTKNIIMGGVYYLWRVVLNEADQDEKQFARTDFSQEYKNTIQVWKLDYINVVYGAVR